MRPQRWLLLGRAHFQAVTTDAPLALWPGAGDGHGRPLLLRAHPLLHDGIIDGPVFGRRVAALNVEGQRWFAPRSLVQPAVAAFADAAFASRRMPSAEGRPMHVDIGVGLRLRVPGRDGMLRVDFGHGLRDGRHALSLGWQLGT